MTRQLAVREAEIRASMTRQTHVVFKVMVAQPSMRLEAFNYIPEGLWGMRLMRGPLASFICRVQPVLFWRPKREHFLISDEFGDETGSRT